ncbi:MAG: glycosyl hydrolase family 65 protein [Eubacteriales bacterium]|nr:glycosyl hydrolase family 65 protein [Eubacteriales bacterium]
MAKIADIYFKEDPWKIVEEGFDPEHGLVAESVFSQANEYMGIRGYLEEGYSGSQLKGSYFNGIYEQLHQDGPHYKGITDTTEFMVNGPDWLYTRIIIDGKRLDLASAGISRFRRVLDMRSGLLTRSFLWHIDGEREAEVVFERLLSMKEVETAAQRISIRPLNFSGKLEIRAGIDFSMLHMSAGENFWKNIKVNQETVEDGDAFLSMKGETLHTGQKVCSGVRFSVQRLCRKDFVCREKKAWILFEGRAECKEQIVLERSVKNLVCRETSGEEVFQDLTDRLSHDLREISFEKIMEDDRSWWSDVWSRSDIRIEGDPSNQQGIRFCIFQLFQTYHGAVDGSNIGAKGLTGEAYNGNAFWDTETYCLPFFLFQDRNGARNLLRFRYRTLSEAKKRARELDCEGAFYPIATISGKECCNLWQHSSLQLQASTAVAYGIWFYERETGDRDFLWECGLEMLIEISRMLASRGDFFDNNEKYGYFCVMGPDEFQMMVNHNFYTNAMGKFVFEYTIREIKRVFGENPEVFYKVCDKTGLLRSEPVRWQEMAEKMYLPYDEETGLYEQHDGFFKLPHVDVDAIPVEEFPLYNHWSYDRIYRNDMIKQPDVLMLMLLFNQSFSRDVLEKHYAYYEPRCIHESSLSPSVHSILAAQLGRSREAYEFFRFATRMDLDNYNRNSGEGIHTTSIAAAWMNIVYGFGGFRSDGPIPVLNPTIPESWKGYSFHLMLGGRSLEIRVENGILEIAAGEGEELHLLVYGKEIALGQEVYRTKIPEEWRNADGMGNS